MRARRLDPRPRVALLAIATCSAAIHALAALAVHSPLFSPDEWLYGLISRSFLTHHPGEIHGGHLPLGTTISYLGPLVTAPVWLVHDIVLAYHLGQALASIAFAAAVFPAYALGRRLGLDARTSLVGALCSQLIPAGAFTATLLAEPFAYPVLLAAVVLAIDAIARPTVLRVASLAAATVVLCLTGGFQFLVYPIACFGAWIVAAETLRGAARRLALSVGAALASVALVELAGGASVLARIRDGAEGQHYPIPALAGWFGIDAFALAAASGWIIVPAALVGVGRLLRGADVHARAFGGLCVLLTLGFLGEAAIWGANGNGIYERFTFYATPLLVLAFLHDVERRRDANRLPYAVIGYAAAAAALLVPLTADLVANQGHSPTMLGLTDDRAVRILWPPAFAVLAVLAAAAGPSRRVLLGAVAIGVLLLTNAWGFRTLTRYQTYRAPDLGAPSGTALLANPVEVGYDTQTLKVLFWNPPINRLVVLGGGASPDPAPALQGGLGAGDVLDDRGAVIPGPFAVGASTSAWRGTRLLADGGPALLDGVPDTVGFGIGAGGGLAPVAELIAGAGGNGRRLVFRVVPVGGAVVRLDIRCTRGRPSHARWIVSPARARSVAIDVPARTTQSCRLSLAPGSGAFQEKGTIARATLVAAD